ncbi:TetR/AcrR family transcriptional regulator [Sphaerisporangium fuscum]|uniref:TetR/AcrR family transcriptional regulator n=1 Tax=Sphaerisporangium fuscum TaxID=2835868 RepID=UPI001BDCCD67|nr:TetR/AcrR family transcriptional regulator [Sphaerisporangium fuscum]
MVETRARRTGGRSARVRAQVLAATIDVLLERGVDGLSVAEVARRAGVHETTVYRRWDSPATLAVEAVVGATQASIAARDTGVLRDDLLALLRDIAGFVQTPLGRLLLQLAARQDLPEYEAVRACFRADRFEAGMEVLDRAARRGELRPGLDRTLTMEALIGPLHVRLLLTGGPLDEDLVTATVDLLTHGITA